MINSPQVSEEVTLVPLAMVPHDTIVRRLTRGICKHLEGEDVNLFTSENLGSANIKNIIKQDRATFDGRLKTLQAMIRTFAEQGGLYFNRKPVDAAELQPVIDKWLSSYAIDEMHMGISMYKDAFEYGSNTLNNLCLANYLYNLYINLFGVEKAEDLLTRSLRNITLNPSTGLLTWNWLRDELISRIFQGTALGANKLPIGTVPHSVVFLDISSRVTQRVSADITNIPVFGKLFKMVDKDTGTHVQYMSSHLRLSPQRMSMFIMDCGLSRRYVRMLEHKVNKIPGFSLMSHTYVVDRSNISAIAGNTSTTVSVTTEGISDAEIAENAAQGIMPISLRINTLRGNVRRAPDDYEPQPGEAKVLGLIFGYDRDRIDVAGVMDESVPPQSEGACYNREVWALVKRAAPNVRNMRTRNGAGGANGITVLSVPDALVCPEDVIKVITGMLESSRTLGVFSPCQLI